GGLAQEPGARGPDDSRLISTRVAFHKCYKRGIGHIGYVDAQARRPLLSLSRRKKQRTWSKKDVLICRRVRQIHLVDPVWQHSPQIKATAPITIHLQP